MDSTSNMEPMNPDLIHSDLKGIHNSDQVVVPPEPEPSESDRVPPESDKFPSKSDQVSLVAKTCTVYVIEQVSDSNVVEEINHNVNSRSTSNPNIVESNASDTSNTENNHVFKQIDSENGNVDMTALNDINKDNANNIEIINEIAIEPEETKISNQMETEDPPTKTTLLDTGSASAVESTVSIRTEHICNSSLASVFVPTAKTNTVSAQSTSSTQLKLHYDYLKNDCTDLLTPQSYKRIKVDIFTEDQGPKWHDVHGNVITETIVPEMVVKAFEHLPVFGRPNSKADLEEFQNNKIREFVGCDLSEEDFEKLAKYCSPKHLDTGEELKLSSNLPNPGVTLTDRFEGYKPLEREDNELYIVKKYRLRQVNDAKNQAIMRLKYRSLRLLPFSLEDDITADTDPEKLLEPGKDLLYQIRLYRPFIYNQKDKASRGRSVIISRTVTAAGRMPLWALRDRLLCPNDLDVRLDVSNNPNETPSTCAKELFPSGFMFINNVFYVDTREGCRDISAPIRAWANAKRLAEFPKKDMNITLDQMRIKLGHPEVYIHQGNCEHPFTFSEIRLVNATDPLRLTSYPMVTGMSQNHTVYCTTCGEFGAKWIVTGCRRLPFDPAYFCDACYRLYLYDSNDQKIGDFKAYSYMGNDLNVLKSV